MLTDDERREVVRLCEPIAVHAARATIAAAPRSGALPLAEWKGAVVGASAGPRDNVTVKLDGDVNSLTSGVQNATGQPLVAGERVQVLILPTGGAFVVGFVGAQTMSGWQVTQSGLTVVTTTVTDLAWNGQTKDSHGFVTPTFTTWTVPTGWGGLWHIGVEVDFTNVIATRGFLNLIMTGTYANTLRQPFFGESQGAWSWPVLLAAGDTVKLQVFQQSGGNQTAVATMAAWFLGSVLL